jgi:dihydroorotate dehydrogenase
VFPFRLIRPWLFALDPERAHAVALAALASGLAGRRPPAADPRLRVQAFGLDFPNPIGLAAGFDKNARAPDAALALGFGFVEVGSITPEPQAGNPRPRLFRLTEDRAVINRLGFNNSGLDRAAARLAARRGRSGIVGANLGANKESVDRIADYVAGYRALHGYVAYVTVNVSSPNTPGLRALQSRAALGELLDRLHAARTEALAGGARPVPILAKVAPDLDPDERAAIAEVALAKGLDGLVVGNTTIGGREGLTSRHRHETGGLSGAPLFALSTAVLRDFYRLTEGRLPLIGVGGIGSGADAYTKIRAGATLVQLYTAMVYDGPGLVGRANAALAALLDRDGFASVAAAVGTET